MRNYDYTKHMHKINNKPQNDCYFLSMTMIVFVYYTLICLFSEQLFLFICYNPWPYPRNNTAFDLNDATYRFCILTDAFIFPFILPPFSVEIYRFDGHFCWEK